MEKNFYNQNNAVKEAYESMFSMFRYEPTSNRRKRDRCKSKRPIYPKKKVLIVDDSLKAITPLNIIFRNLDCETVLSFDGLSSVREIMAYRPSLIVLDWTMPDMSGGEAIQLAQQEMAYNFARLPGEALKNKIPIVTFSANPLENLDIPECEDFQFLDHWQKPLSYAELTQRAARLLKTSP